MLCFRGQCFERPEQFRAAVLNLGEPMSPVTATYRLPGFDVIEELTNEATDRRTGDRTPLRRGGSWHTDHSNLERPPKATVLHAIEVPNEGGNTEFTSLYLAYEAFAGGGQGDDPGTVGLSRLPSPAVRTKASCPHEGGEERVAPDVGSPSFAATPRPAVTASISTPCAATRWRA